jgi:alpha/beta superfamily hydrolase
MTASSSATIDPKRRRRTRIVRTFFVVWGTFALGVLFNQFRTQNVDALFLVNSEEVIVKADGVSLEFHPNEKRSTGLLFFCGSGVEADAYAPMLRPISEQGYTVIIVKLPGRFAMLPGQKEIVMETAQKLIKSQPEIRKWVISGHSLGAALSCKFVQKFPESSSALVLVGTTHPKEDSLSGLTIPVTKVFGSVDGVAPVEKVDANRSLLPLATKWIKIKGANHSQFGNYGHQLQDGSATISREAQQSLVREEILNLLKQLDIH